HYQKLKADLDPIEPSSREYAFIKTYMENTGAQYYRMKLIDAFRVDRRGERERFAAHGDIVERRLLWHGTNVAVGAAILGSGLRIMPHAGGRVGKGIYLASENGKSLGYVGWNDKTGGMVLAEGALGKGHSIHQDHGRPTAAAR